MRVRSLHQVNEIKPSQAKANLTIGALQDSPPASRDNQRFVRIQNPPVPIRRLNHLNAIQKGGTCELCRFDSTGTANFNLSEWESLLGKRYGIASMLTLVTGSTGLLGNNVTRKLLAQGDQVRVLVRAANQAPRPFEGLDVERVDGDLSQAETLRSAVEDVGLVIHCAGDVRIGWTGLDRAMKINAEGTQYLAQAARKAGAKMVHVSTVNTLGLGSPDSPANEDAAPEDQIPCTYVRSKIEAETRFLAEVEGGLEGVVVNPGFMLGPWDWKPSSGQMLLEVAQRFTPAAPPGGCSVVDVRDVADGILKAAAKGKTGQRYILAGHNMTYFDLWVKMAEVSGGSKPRFRLGPFIRWISGTAGDLVGKVTKREPLINSAAVGMSAQYHYYTSQKAIDELDYQFRDATESIEAAWNWFCENGYANQKA